MKNYTISDVRMYEGDRNSDAKNVVLKANSKMVAGIGKSLERTTDSRTLNALGNNVVNECYIDLTLDKLRELDSNVDAQQAYIRSRSRFLDSDNLRLFIIKLRIENEQRLDPLDYGYLLSLLNWSRNDLPLMPILEFGDSFETPEQIKTYEDFVKTMIARRANFSRLDDIAMSIPIYLPRRRLENLFKLYKDIKPTFIAMDLNNKRVDSIPDGKYDTILEHFKKESEEKTFLYGMNVKPYKNGKDNPSALDVQSLHWSFNSVGPTHHKFVKRMILSSSWENAGRVFDAERIGYIAMDDEHLHSFIDWVDGKYGFRFDEDYSKNVHSAYPYIKRYNFTKTNQELAMLSESLNKGETDMVDRAFDMLPEGVRTGRWPILAARTVAYNENRFAKKR